MIRPDLRVDVNGYRRSSMLGPSSTKPVIGGLSCPRNVGCCPSPFGMSPAKVPPLASTNERGAAPMTRSSCGWAVSPRSSATRHSKNASVVPYSSGLGGIDALRKAEFGAQPKKA
eukprot:scaffold30993_cov242-Isochrysis_galbana.AAC.6